MWMAVDGLALLIAAVLARNIVMPQMRFEKRNVEIYFLETV